MPSNFLFGLFGPCTLTAGQSFHSQLVPLVVFEQILRSSIKRLDRTLISQIQSAGLLFGCWGSAATCFGSARTSAVEQGRHLIRQLFCCTRTLWGCTLVVLIWGKQERTALEITDLLPVNKWKIGSPPGSQKEGKKEKVWFVSTTRIHCC